MIEPTDEMLYAALDAYDELCDGQRSEDGIRAGLAAVLEIVERDYNVLPKFRPEVHAFVRSDDPSFGSAFGGGCAAEVRGMICGWPEQAHRRGRGA